MHTAAMSMGCAFFPAKHSLLPVKKMDFASAKSRKRKLSDGHPPTSSSSKSARSHIAQLVTPKNHLVKLNNFFTKIECLPSVLSLVPQYADNYIPKSMLPTYPKPLLELFQPKFLELDYTHLLAQCTSIRIQLTEEMILNIEQDTKGQSNSKLWFKFRKSTGY